MENLIRPVVGLMLLASSALGGFVGYNALNTESPPQGEMVCTERPDGKLDCKLPEMPVRDLPKEGER